MSDTIRFSKMHGAGNDYIYVDTFKYPIPDPQSAAIQWSAPHTGIGSDGLVLICPPSDNSVKADFRMRIFNADGSEAKMCGNASRCIGKYLYEKGICHKRTIKLETLSGVKRLLLHTDDNDCVKHVTVDMLEPVLTQPRQYIAQPDNTLKAGSLSVKGTFVSMGNPHFVVFVDDVDHTDVTSIGSQLERNEAFPERCNIEFAQKVGRNEIRTRVWERGSGITMACGTGACATAVAASVKGVTGRSCNIIMDGGTLNIEWSETDNHVYLTGPASFVFEGEIEL